MWSLPGRNCVSFYRLGLIFFFSIQWICENIINNNDERTHFFRKIHLSHFILERVALVMCERWVGDGTDCNILTPSSSISALLPNSAGLLNWGPEGPSPLSSAGSHYSSLSPTVTGTRTVTATRTELYLPRTPTEPKPSVAPGYIIVFRPPASCGLRFYTEFNPSSGQGDFPISSTVHLFLDWRLVEGQ